ncbi:MAG: MFS transporter, partial [Armatimonadetes bacterium]|nr:MFS transporter [Armatimonadota bacterium]
MEYKGLALATTATGSFMSTTEATEVNIAYPVLVKVFNTDISTVVWLGIAYFLVSVGLLLTFGWVGDATGRGRVYVWGLAIFTLGLVLNSLAMNIYMLIGSRSFHAVGTAMVLSNGNAITVAAFPPEQRGMGLGLQSAVAGLGLASGPLIGGVILDALGWRAIFYTRIPLAVVAFLIGWSFLRRGEGARIDWLGALLLFLTIASFLLAINQAGRSGLMHPLVIAPFALGLVFLPALISVERRTARPVLDLSLFREPRYTMGLAAIFTIFLTWVGVSLLSPFFMINGMGFSATKAGLYLTTFSILRPFFAPLSGWLSDRISRRMITTTAVLVVAAGLGLLTQVRLDSPEVLLLTALAISGLGQAFFDPPNNSDILGSVPRDRLGTASASIVASRQTAMSTGTALMGALFAYRAASFAGIRPSEVNPSALPPEAVAAGVKDAFLVAV